MSQSDRMLRWRFGLRERSAYWDDMAKFVAAGIAPFTVLTDMVKVYSKRRKLRWKGEMLRRTSRRMEDGTALADALSRYIPPEEAAMLASGESVGKLVDACKQLTFTTRKRAEAMGLLWSSLTPAFVFFWVMVGIMIFMMNTILTEAGKLIPPEIMAKLMLAPLYFGFGEFVLGNLVWILGGMTALAIAVFLSLSRWRPTDVIRQKLDLHVPPWSLYVRLQSAFFLLTMAGMMQSGITFRPALEQIRRNATPWMRTHLNLILKRLETGRPEVECLMTGIMPIDIEDRLSIYSKMPNFAETMDQVARDSMDILLQRVAAIGKAVNIGMMVFMGFFLIMTVFSIGEIGISIDPRNLRQVPTVP